MAEHKASVEWTHHRGEFLKGTCSREHTWAFDGGAVERAAALFNRGKRRSRGSICRCDFQLPHADVLVSEDDAIGHTEKNARGHPWMSLVELRPKVIYRGRTLNREEDQALHYAAYEECTIANSVTTKITIAASPTR